MRLSAGAAQYRKTAAELVQKYHEVEAALRKGDLCLSSVIELAKVLTSENAAEVLPRFFGLSSRDAAFVAASIRPVENPPRRDFVVTPARASASPPEAASDPAGSLLFRAPEPLTVESSPAPYVASPAPPPIDRPKVKPLDATRANATRSGAASGPSRVRRLRRRTQPRRRPSLLRRNGAATSPRRSGAPSGSATTVAARGPSRRAASADPHARSSSTTSTGGPSARTPPSRRVACSAACTRTSRRGTFTATSS